MIQYIKHAIVSKRDRRSEGMTDMTTDVTASRAAFSNTSLQAAHTVTISTCSSGSSLPTRRTHSGHTARLANHTSTHC